THTQKKRRQWNVRKKLMVIFYQESRHSIRATADRFEIEPKQVSPYVRRLNTSARPKYPQLEKELLEWFHGLRGQLKTVTRFMISAKARNLARRQEYRTLYPDVLEFPGVKGVRIGIEEEEENSESFPEDIESDPENEYYENEEENYINIWD
ncbi:22640_t:CDS:2, partial [Dentiscutata erythropus]